MNLTKSLIYYTIGFIFLLVDLNVKIAGVTINIFPDFIAWIVFFVAIEYLGEYGTRKNWMKIISVVQIILNATEWALTLLPLEFPYEDILDVVIIVLEAIYVLYLTKILEWIAEDHEPSRIGLIRFMRVIFLVAYLMIVSIFFLYYNADETAVVIIAMIALALAFCGLVMLVITMTGMARKIAAEPKKEEGAGV